MFYSSWLVLKGQLHKTKKLRAKVLKCRLTLEFQGETKPWNHEISEEGGKEIHVCIQ